MYIYILQQYGKKVKCNVINICVYFYILKCMKANCFLFDEGLRTLVLKLDTNLYQTSAPYHPCHRRLSAYSYLSCSREIIVYPWYMNDVHELKKQISICSVAWNLKRLFRLHKHLLPDMMGIPKALLTIKTENGAQVTVAGRLYKNMICEFLVSMKISIV